jgi:uncharacterized protein (DUF362 family)
MSDPMRREPCGQREIPRREFIKLAALAGLLAGCGPTRQASAPQATLSTATAIPTSPPTAASSPTLPPTATATATATSTPVPTATPSPTITPSPIPVDEGEMVRLAFVKTRDRAEGVRQALRLLDLNPVQGKGVLLKPNLNSADPAPASTHPATLRVLAEELWGMGARSITVADRSGQGNTRRVMEALSISELAAELELETLCFDLLWEKEDWVRMRPPDSHWKRGFQFPRVCLEAEALVQTCCLKTHRFGGHFTLSLKNSVGMVPVSDLDTGHVYMDELHESGYQRHMIAEINTAYTPALVVMDGVEAFIAGGPDKGTHAWGEVVVAGTDRVAIDAVGVALLRHLGCGAVGCLGPIFQQDQIARAVELGLGVDMPQKIQFVTGDPDSERYAAQIRDILLTG